MRVKEIMARAPVYCTESCTVQMAITLMRDHGVGILPVVTDLRKELVGVVTDRDLCIRLLVEGRDASAVTVSACMTLDPICCGLDDEVEHAMTLMSDHQLRRILVVNRRHELAGIVSVGDLLRCHVGAEKVCEMLRAMYEPELVASH